MGVLSFYRWLVEKYPKIVRNAVEERPDSIDWSMKEPPNGAIDNLYLDMNGIIHPCFHPEDQLLLPTTYDQVFVAMFEYIDRLFGIVRPRKLLFMAIDGVAPRAKMNQQRARRYKNAKEAAIAEAEEDRLRKEYQMKGIPVLPKQESDTWDSNVITPGTLFMDRLSRALEYYIRLRLNIHPGWKNIKVILSDANVPGEGEHKIMAFIRQQRNRAGYNPNTRHCLYGSDADLIMLALATHEIHFSILREDVVNQNNQEISLASLEKSLPLTMKENVRSRQWFKKTDESDKFRKSCDLQFLHIWTLREYLELEFTIPDSHVELDIERIIDDFIFICFFAGNDFLPRIPCIEIHECVIDLLIHAYKTELKPNSGYLVDTTRLNEKKAAYIKPKRIMLFIQLVARFEQKIYEKRCNLRMRKLQRMLEERAENIDEQNSEEKLQIKAESNSSQDIVCNISGESPELDNSEVLLNNTKDMIGTLKTLLREKGDLFKKGFQADRVRLHMSGAEDRYYRIKFSEDSPAGIEKIRKEVVSSYIEGLCWTLRYYYEGVCSWNWFYPYHYGPLASSIKNFCCTSVNFKLGKPFKPFDQLMAVLPPRSAHVLPEAYKKLMTSEDSRILEFYPQEFEIDVDGKRFEWQGIVKLPLIKEDLLLSETRNLDQELKADELNRNSIRFDKIFSLDSSPFGSLIISLYGGCNLSSGNSRTENRVSIDPTVSDGINGYLCPCDGELRQGVIVSPVNGMEDIVGDNVSCAIFENPDPQEHLPRLLSNVEVPLKMITREDLEDRLLWHEYPGYRPPIRKGRAQYYHPRTVEGLENREHTSMSSGLGWRGRGKSLACVTDLHRYGGSRAMKPDGRGHGVSEMQQVGCAGDFTSVSMGQRWEAGGGGAGGLSSSAGAGREREGFVSGRRGRSGETPGRGGPNVMPWRGRGGLGRADSGTSPA